ncbi:hypothetical protein [Kordiimonas pumila]|uniref:Uncharacterized protein n=1 Tax=Kordiimonas pumila TaxID=2161677 RepID=A0ABV7D6X4_9PROT|nr:hypothetical protein [Kordiimonas pumila]
MNTSILNTADFPIVWFTATAVSPGFAEQWIVEMDKLLAQQKPFVMIVSEPPKEDTSKQDKKALALWFKKNKIVFSGTCTGVVGIIPSPIKRKLMQLQTKAFEKAFGIKLIIIARSNDATRAAHAMLTHAN